MKIIPYFIDYEKVQMISFNMILVRLRILLEGGKTIWTDSVQTTQTINRELEENDIYGSCEFSDDDAVVWVNVDASKTPMSDFYTYEEVTENNFNVPDNALLWRTFRTLVDHNIILHHDLPEPDLFRSLIKKKIHA